MLAQKNGGKQQQHNRFLCVNESNINTPSQRIASTIILLTKRKTAIEKMKLLLSFVLGSCLLWSTFAFAPGTRSSSRTTRLFMADAAPPAPPPRNKQPEYGQSLELPDTYVRCGRCQTVYAITPEDLGKGKGRRLECTVCQHSWFQSRDRVLKVREEFEMVPLPSSDKDRIALNLQEGRAADFVGEAKLYVGNIAFECSEDDLKKLFEDVGTVGDISLVKDDRGRNRGFGFVTMRLKTEAEKAIADLDGTSVRGRNIAVRESTS